MSDRSCSRLVVLAYHAIADSGKDPVLRRYSVPPARFVRQLDSLAREGWKFVDADAVLDALAGHRGLPRRAALLTFDDGYADFEREALPVLRRRGIPAVVFVLGDRVGGTNEWDQANGAGSMRLMDAAALHRVAAAGVEIGSHGLGHHSMARLEPAELPAEALDSADRIEALGLPRPRLFAYTYGHLSPEAVTAVRDAGYRAAFTITPGFVEPGADLHALSRVMVLRGYVPLVLRLRLAVARWPSHRLEEWFKAAGRWP